MDPDSFSSCRRSWLAGAAGLPLMALSARVGAQATGADAAADWPKKPVRILLGYPPGGSADGTARPIEPKLAAALGQPMLFDYKPGAGATIAADMAAKAPADGYTLHYVDSGPMVILPHGRKLGYDPFKSFTPIGNVCTGGTLLVVHPSVKANTLQDLIAMAKEKPGALSFATSGIGGAGHLAAELLQSMAGIQMSHVPYKGGNQAASDLIGGQIPVLFSSMGTAIPHIKQGRMKAIAVSSAKRSSGIPDVPTIAEQGLPGFEATVWFGMVGPAGLPDAIVKKVNAAINAALADSAVRETIVSLGFEPDPGTPEKYAALIRSDSEKWGKLIRDANIVLTG